MVVSEIVEEGSRIMNQKEGHIYTYVHQIRYSSSGTFFGVIRYVSRWYNLKPHLFVSVLSPLGVIGVLGVSKGA